MTKKTFCIGTALVLLMGCAGRESDPGGTYPPEGPDGAQDGGLGLADAMAPDAPAEEPDLYPDGPFSGSVEQNAVASMVVRDAVFRHIDSPNGSGESVLVLTAATDACATYDESWMAWNAVDRVEIVFARGNINATQGDAYWKTQATLGPTFPAVAEVSWVRNRFVSVPVWGDVVTTKFEDGRIAGTARLRFEGDPDDLYTDIAFDTKRRCEVLQ